MDVVKKFCCENKVSSFIIYNFNVNTNVTNLKVYCTTDDKN